MKAILGLISIGFMAAPMLLALPDAEEAKKRVNAARAARAAAIEAKARARTEADASAHDEAKFKAANAKLDAATKEVNKANAELKEAGAQVRRAPGAAEKTHGSKVAAKAQPVSPEGSKAPAKPLPSLPVGPQGEKVNNQSHLNALNREKEASAKLTAAHDAHTSVLKEAANVHALAKEHNYVFTEKELKKINKVVVKSEAKLNAAKSEHAAAKAEVKKASARTIVNTRGSSHR